MSATISRTTSLRNYSDQELISIFDKHPELVIEEIIHRYQAPIYTSIYLLVKDKYLADDIYQETIIKVYQNLQKTQYVHMGKFLPWACRIAHNLCIDHFRKVKKNIKVTLMDGTDIIKIFLSEHEVVHTHKEDKLRSHIIHQAINNLPLDQKEVVIMRVYAEMSFKDIANYLGISINTALGRMRYAIINLRKEFEKINFQHKYL